MAAATVNGWHRRHAVQINRNNRIDRVDQRYRIGAVFFRATRWLANIGDVRRQLGDHRHTAILLAPFHDHPDIFRHLTDSRTHAAFAHAVRTAKVQLDAVGTGFFHQGQDCFPRFFFAWHHDRSDQCAVGPAHFHFFHFAQVHFKRTVGDQLDIVKTKQAPVGTMDGAIARAIDIDHRRAFGTKRFPDHATPASLESPFDIVSFVRRWGRSQPERVWRLDAEEVR